MALLEQASGARMHTALYRPFSVDTSGLTQLFFRELALFLSRAARSLAGAFCGLLANRSLRTRLAQVGQVSSSRALQYSISGLIARSSGLFLDCRLRAPTQYASYPSMSFSSFLGRRGDNFDRFLLRVKETVECFHLLAQVLAQLQPITPPTLPLTQSLTASHLPELEVCLFEGGYKPKVSLTATAALRSTLARAATVSVQSREEDLASNVRLRAVTHTTLPRTRRAARNITP